MRISTCMFALVFLAMGSLVMAGENQSKQDQEATLQRTNMETAYSIRDAKTGKLRNMTPAERDAAGLRPLLLETPKTTIFVSGDASKGRAIIIEGMSHLAVARVNSDGSISEACVNSLDGLNSFNQADSKKEEPKHVQ